MTQKHCKQKNTKLCSCIHWERTNERTKKLSFDVAAYSSIAVVLERKKRKNAHEIEIYRYKN